MKTKEELVNQITKTLMDQGLIIEAGWAGLRMMVIPENAPPAQVEEMRNAFYAGAQHLFASIMVGLDPDIDPTPDDLKRIDLIDVELRRFAAEFEAKLHRDR